MKKSDCGLVVRGAARLLAALITCCLMWVVSTWTIAQPTACAQSDDCCDCYKLVEVDYGGWDWIWHSCPPQASSPDDPPWWFPPDYSPIGPNPCDGCLPLDPYQLWDLPGLFYRQRDALQGRFIGLQANSVVNVVLLHQQLSDDPNVAKMRPLLIDQLKVGADGVVKLDALGFNVVPGNAPSGRYLLVAYPGDSSLREALKNLRPQQVQSFQLPPRISAVVAKPLEKSPGKFDSLQMKWSYEAQPGDRLQVQWYRDGQKYGDLHSVGTLPQDASPQLPRSSVALRFSPSRFTGLLPFSNIFDALDDDRQGMRFYAPQTGAFTAFPGLKKVFPGLSTPPLESGTYKVEIYLNGALEGTKEVTIP